MVQPCIQRARFARRTVLIALCLGGCSNDPAGAADAGASAEERFSFFVTSLKAMRALSGSEDGFGGDLRFGETGPGAGLRGADKICAAVAERSAKGASAKRWRAFLSATQGEDGEPVHAIDRIGDGPWYDRVGRLVAATKADLLHARPRGADSAIVNDLPNEDGVPNLRPDPNEPEVDNHDVLTGTNSEGRLYSATATCKDWTSALGDPATEGRPRVGHSWERMGGVAPRPDGGPGGPIVNGMFPRGPGPLDGGAGVPNGPQGCPAIAGPGPSGAGGPMDADDGGMEPRICTAGEGPMMRGGPGGAPSWMSVLDEAGCAAGINLVQTGPPDLRVPTVGSGGGYGAIYCFALSP